LTEESPAEARARLFGGSSGARDSGSGVTNRSFQSVATLVFAVAGLIVVVALMAAVQWHGRGYDAEFGTLLSDEPAHYVNGLLVAEYLRHGLFESPLAFAQSFYLQYPKVTIGHWPPAFYLLAGAWMAAISASKISVLLLSALLTAMLTVLVAGIVGRRMGWIAGAVAGLAFALLPLVRDTTLSLMLDVWVGLLSLAATLCYVQYLNTRRWWPAMLFALFAAVAILSKGNGLELALVPPLALLASRQFDLLRQATFWLPALVVAVLCGPWTALTYKATQAGFFYTWGLDYFLFALSRNSPFLLATIGPVGLCLVAVAVAPLLRSGWSLWAIDRPERHFRAGMFSLFLAVFIFQVVVPASVETRYLIPALPPLVLLIAAGLQDVLHWGSRVAAPNRASAIGLLGASLLVLGIIAPDVLALRHWPAKPLLGMVPAAQEIVARLPPDRLALVLVGSGGEGEGSFVAEIALQDPSRHIVVARGLNMLASGDFGGRDYRTRFESAAAVADFVNAAAVQFVVIDTSARSLQWRHMHQLIEAVSIAGWTRIARYAHDGVDGETLVYCINQNLNRQPDMALLARTIGRRSPF